MLDAAGRNLLESLKIAALAKGVRAAPDALEFLGGEHALTVHEYATTGGIPLRVGGLEINAPFDDWFCADAEIDLVLDRGTLVLEFQGERLQVENIAPLPGYLGRVGSSGIRISDLAFSHLDRVRLSPIAGCAYDCAFCDMPGRVRLHTVDQLLEAAEVAIADEALPARHLLISGGSPGPRDEDAFAGVLVELTERLSTMLPVDIMMAAGPKSVDLVERLVAAGAAGFSLNIELESEHAGQLHIRGKQRRSRPHYDDTVAAAVERLGRTGRVRSLILPGLEPVSDTLRGVEHIASLGADPVLSPFRPAPGTRLHRQTPTVAADLRVVLDESRSIVAQHGVALGPRCLPCQHNTMTFPWDVPSDAAI